MLQISYCLNVALEPALGLAAFRKIHEDLHSFGSYEPVNEITGGKNARGRLRRSHV